MPNLNKDSLEIFETGSTLISSPLIKVKTLSPSCSLTTGTTTLNLPFLNSLSAPISRKVAPIFFIALLCPGKTGSKRTKEWSMYKLSPTITRYASLNKSIFHSLVNKPSTNANEANLAALYMWSSIIRRFNTAGFSVNPVKEFSLFLSLISSVAFSNGVNLFCTLR